MSQGTTSSVAFISTRPPESTLVPEPDDSLLERLAAGMAVGDSDLRPDDAPMDPSDSPEQQVGSHAEQDLRPKRRMMRQAPRFWIPRPDLFTRLLLGASLVLLATVTVLAALVSRALHGQLPQVEDEVNERHLVILQQPLPSDQDLLHDRRFAQHMVDMPHQQSDLHRRRAELLMAENQLWQAADHYRLARLTASQPPTLGEWLEEIDCWLLMGYLEQAEQQLSTLLRRPLATTDQVAIHARIGRITLLQQQRANDA